MLDYLKSLWTKAIELGLPLPHAYDPVAKEPSFRLLCAYTSFIMAASSVVGLHFFNTNTATWTSIGFFALCMIFYMLKKLTKAKVDLDDKSIELDSQES